MRTLLRAFVALIATLPVGAQQSTPQKLREEIQQLGTSLDLPHTPPADSFAIGGRVIPAHTIVDGDVAAANGALEIHGRVNGNAIVLRGDLLVEPGATITGDAIAAGGHVRMMGGTVEGEVRSLSSVPLGGDAAASLPQEPPLTTWKAVKLVVSCFGVLLIIGIGVMMFAEPNLTGVEAVLERRLAAAFWAGLLAELALLPVLLLLVVALAISIIGALLIPFAIVAYVIVAAGLLALGFLAIARFTGRGFVRVDANAPVRGVDFRRLFSGLTAYAGVWFVVAALLWVPTAQPVLRAVAMAITWVALTAGLGATVLSRAGTQHERTSFAPHTPSPSEQLGWQTPTPVAGVAAARRPASVSKDPL